MKYLFIISVFVFVYVKWLNGYEIYPCKGIKNVTMSYYDFPINGSIVDFFFKIHNFLPANTRINITFIVKNHRASSFEPTAVYLESQQDEMGIFLLKDNESFNITFTTRTRPLLVSLQINDTEICHFPRGDFLDEKNIPSYEIIPVNFDEEDDDTCGQRKTGGVEIVVNGRSTKPGDWPWHAALYLKETQHAVPRYICGGTLIAPSTILTAAHCVTSNGIPVLPDVLTVFLGKYNLTEGDETSVQRKVSKVIVHENYNYSRVLNDIALLKLDKDLEYNNYIQPACLWRKSDFFKLGQPTKIFGTAIGWGIDQTFKLASELRQLYMPKVEDIECIRSNSLFFSKSLNEHNFCAGYRNGSSACNGDSGGGFFVFVPEIVGDTSYNAAGTWHIRGITSLAFAERNFDRCDPNQYVLFTDVAKLINWVVEHKGVIVDSKLEKSTNSISEQNNEDD